MKVSVHHARRLDGTGVSSVFEVPGNVPGNNLGNIHRYKNNQVIGCPGGVFHAFVAGIAECLGQSALFQRVLDSKSPSDLLHSVKRSFVSPL